jgi:hypothetical protein
MSIKLHKVIHCFDSLIILLYEHPFTIYFDTHRLECHRCLALQTRLLIKNTQPKHKLKNKILFNLTFIIISFMTYKNSILELILTDTNVLTEEHRYRTNAYRCTKKNNPYHVTILTQVIIGILDLWNASTYLSIPQII